MEFITVKDKICAILAELIGTALLVFMGCTCVCSSERSLFEISIAFGVAVMVLMQTFIPASGALLNPSLTIAAIVYRSLSITMAIGYIIAQFIGSILGYYLVFVLFNEKIKSSNNACLTTVNEKLSPIQILLLEFVATGILVLINCGFWDQRNEKKGASVPIMGGLTVAGLIIVFGPLTGASLNTARSFAPAMITRNWKNHWYYWVSPPLSGLFFSGLYKIGFWKAPELKIKDITHEKFDYKPVELY